MDLPEMGADRPDPMAFGAALGPGLGLNLLVADLPRAARWQVAALGARILYWEADFAVMEAAGARWLLHSDRSYRAHPLRGAVADAPARGLGAEFRLYGLDPDAAEARARDLPEGAVLAPAADKPHGLREAHLVDPEGYVWVPSTPLAGAARR